MQKTIFPSILPKDAINMYQARKEINEKNKKQRAGISQLGIDEEEIKKIVDDKMLLRLKGLELKNAQKTRLEHQFQALKDDILSPLSTLQQTVFQMRGNILSSESVYSKKAIEAYFSDPTLNISSFISVTASTAASYGTSTLTIDRVYAPQTIFARSIGDSQAPLGLLNSKIQLSDTAGGAVKATVQISNTDSLLKIKNNIISGSQGLLNASVIGSPGEYKLSISAKVDGATIHIVGVKDLAGISDLSAIDNQVRSDWFNDANAPLGLSGNLVLCDAVTDPLPYAEYTVAVNNTDSLTDIMNNINNHPANQGPTATIETANGKFRLAINNDSESRIVNNSKLLEVSASATPAVVGGSGLDLRAEGLGLTLSSWSGGDLNIRSQSPLTSAQITIDNVTVTNPKSNMFDGKTYGISGIEIVVYKPTPPGTNITITVDQDLSSFKNDLMAMVSAYNNFRSNYNIHCLQDQNSIAPEQRKHTGLLANNVTFSSIKNSLDSALEQRIEVAQNVSYGLNTFGIKRVTQKIKEVDLTKEGILEISEDIMNQKLSTIDFNNIKKLFALSVTADNQQVSLVGFSKMPSTNSGTFKVNFHVDGSGKLNSADFVNPNTGVVDHSLGAFSFKSPLVTVSAGSYQGLAFSYSGNTDALGVEVTVNVGIAAAIDRIMKKAIGDYDAKQAYIDEENATIGIEIKNLRNQLNVEAKNYEEQKKKYDTAYQKELQRAQEKTIETAIRKKQAKGQRDALAALGKQK